MNVWPYFSKILIYSFSACYQSTGPTCIIALVTLCQRAVIASPVYTGKWQQSSGQGVRAPKEHWRIRIQFKFCFSLNKMCRVGSSLYLSRSLHLFVIWVLQTLSGVIFMIFSTSWGQKLTNQNRDGPEYGMVFAHVDWLLDSFRKLPSTVPSCPTHLRSHDPFSNLLMILWSTQPFTFISLSFITFCPSGL